MRELYVYWKAPKASDMAPVRSAQAALAQQHPGLHARLLRRADDSSGAATDTWMEIYAAPAGIGPALQATIEAALAPALAQLAAGPRHAEVFDDRA